MSKDSAAIRVTVARLEETLAGSPAFTRIEPLFYLVHQGSAYVYIHVVPWGGGHDGAASRGPERALVRLVAQLARGVEMTPDLALELLRQNARLRFGSFGYVPQGSCVVLAHTLLGGETLDPDEITTAVHDISMLADEFDDRIVEEAGGKRMQDLLDASVAAAFFADLEASRSEGLGPGGNGPTSAPDSFGARERG